MEKTKKYRVVVQVFGHGKITIPRGVRERLGIKDGNYIEVDIIQLDIPEGEAEDA